MTLQKAGITVLALFIGTLSAPLASAQQGSHSAGLGLGMIFGDTILDSRYEIQDDIWKLDTQEAFFVEGFYRYQITGHLFFEPGVSWTEPDVEGLWTSPGEYPINLMGGLRLINVRANGGWVFNPGAAFEVYGAAGIGLVNWELEVDGPPYSADVPLTDDGNEFAFNFGFGGDIQVVPDKLAIGIGVYDYIWKIEPVRGNSSAPAFHEYETTHHIAGVVRTTFRF